MKKITKHSKFITNLRKMRREKNISGVSLGKAVGMTQAAISGWEHGRTEPDLSTLCALADALGCSTDELLGRPVVGGNVSVTNGNAAVAGHDINGNVGGCAECARKDAVIAEQQKQIGQLISLVAAAKQH